MKQAIIIDLDGTLLRTNTFSDYILYSCCQSLRSCRLDLVFLLLSLSLFRKLRIITHARMKYLILRHTTTFMQAHNRLQSFVTRELTYENPTVVAHLRHYYSLSYVTVLATAAPSLYAQMIASHYHFDHCLATPSATAPYSQWRENKKQEKLHNVQKTLITAQAEISVVITDHSDDQPLLEANREGLNILATQDKYFNVNNRD